MLIHLYGGKWEPPICILTAIQDILVLVVEITVSFQQQEKMRSSTAMANASLPPSVNCCQDLFLLTVQTSLLIYASDLSISIFVLSMSSKFEKEPTNSVVYCLPCLRAFCVFCLVMSNVMLVTTMNVANPLCNV